MRAPSFLVITGPPQSASHGVGGKDRAICGALYPFLEHQSLQDVISLSDESHTRLPLVAKGEVGVLNLIAMAIVHSSGQYHMDVKPSNMLLNNEDNVVVIDWEQCGASPFFLAPEWNSSWDVEVAANTEMEEVQETLSENATMTYRKFTGPLSDDRGTWPKRNVFQLWQHECPRALEAAEVYRVGRSLWVIFEQNDGAWVRERGQPEAKAVMWTRRNKSVPQVWKDFVSRCMSLDPNIRPTFKEGVKFWGQEWKRFEVDTKYI